MLIPDHHPGFVIWKRYEHGQDQLPRIQPPVNPEGQRTGRFDASRINAPWPWPVLSASSSTLSPASPTESLRGMSPDSSMRTTPLRR